jgi:hypothetical protein
VVVKQGKRASVECDGVNVVPLTNQSLIRGAVLSRSSNTILGLENHDDTLNATSTYTQTLTAAATLGDGWAIDVIVDSGVTLTIDPNSTETIDGSATKAIVGPAQGRIVCNGTLFRTIGFTAVQDASDTVKGIIEIADQSEMEAASSTTVAVTPGRQHRHPGHPKVTLKCDSSGTNAQSYGVSSISDTGTGRVTVSFSTNFTSGNYQIGLGGWFAASTNFCVYARNGTNSVGSIELNCVNSSTAGDTDPFGYSCIITGDQ